eukprot:14038712-Ditylum_brightwellii.AAC.1
MQNDSVPLHEFFYFDMFAIRAGVATPCMEKRRTRIRRCLYSPCSNLYVPEKPPGQTRRAKSSQYGP